MLIRSRPSSSTAKWRGRRKIDGCSPDLICTRMRTRLVDADSDDGQVSRSSSGSCSGEARIRGARNVRAAGGVCDRQRGRRVLHGEQQRRGSDALKKLQRPTNSPYLESLKDGNSSASTWDAGVVGAAVLDGGVER